MNQTCRAFRPMFVSFLPTSINLADFEYYQKIDGTSSYGFDACLGIIQSLHDYGWKRVNLKEFHWTWGISGGRDRGGKHETIRLLLRSLFTTHASLPALECLDIDLQSDHVWGFNLIDATILRGLPTALPSLKQLCLCHCVDHEEMVSPHELKDFFECIQTPLESLSLGDVYWMSDDHVEAFMPVVGQHLIRLELVSCMDHSDEEGNLDGDWGDPIKLTDRSASVIAQNCKKLESFSFVNSDIMAIGLQRVISNNPKITTLNLSSNYSLGDNTVDVISRFLPRLRELRNYWTRRSNWLTDDSLISLINAQEKQNGSVSLNLIGQQSSTYLTIRGLEYAIKKGVKVIETDHANRSLTAEMVAKLESEYDVRFWQAKYVHYMDGSRSRCEWTPIFWW
ncbi:hypothetical protein ACHAWC_003510 [Mediolabrus comicus]